MPLTVVHFIGSILSSAGRSFWVILIDHASAVRSPNHNNLSRVFNDNSTDQKTFQLRVVQLASEQKLLQFRHFR